MYRTIYTAIKINRETGKGTVFTSTNMRSVSEHTELGYENLVRIFTRNRKDYWNSPSGWEIVKSVVHYVGGKRGVGTLKYSIKKNY